ncbi:hypothetical protein PG985_000980 [Apiospora marii]|uniref:Uncharacterized protein n=1 Tax=Apiospora marii TaxID=335849 RepID=A0ABR1RGM1_9PEZI
MTPEQEKSIIFNVMLKTNPGLSGGDWVEVASKVGLGHEIVREVHGLMVFTCYFCFPLPTHRSSILAFHWPSTFTNPAGF